MDIDDAVLHFGGEYELLLTVKPRQLKKARKAVEKHGTRFTPIGKVTRRGIKMERDGRAEVIPDLGWEHFKAKRSLKSKKR
jgi:thiamine monophosphate kinase